MVYTMMNRAVDVVPYDPSWPAMFEREAALIKQALGKNCLAVHHIGSTAVPGLSAKPIIDILPVVKNILEVDQAIQEMEKLDYEAKGENGIAFRRFFQKGIPIRTHHVHVFEEGDPEINRHLKFRDWMRMHGEDAQAYAQLKLTLAEKFPNDIFNYCLGKDSFVASIDARDGYQGWRFVQALTDREWEAVCALRQQHFFNLELAPLKEHIHFVFYKESAIIGYAHLQLLEEHRAVLHALVIDRYYQQQGFESFLLQLCERWLRHQGIHMWHNGETQ